MGLPISKQQPALGARQPPPGQGHGAEPAGASGVLLGSLRGRLILLTLAVIVPAVLLAGLLIVAAHGNERALVERQLTATARTLSLVVDRQLGQSEALLRALATSPALERADFAEFHRQAKAAVPEPGQWIMLADLQGRQFVNTRLPWGAPLPARAPPPGAVQAARAGRPYVSNLGPSSSTAQHTVSVAVPVEVAGITYRMLAVIVPAVLSKVLADKELAPGWIAAIIDRSGTIVARSRLEEQFVGTSATADIRAMVLARSEQGVVESTTLDGMKTLAAYSRSPSSGWTVIIGAPKAELLASAIQLLLLVLAVAVALIAVGTFMAAWVARGVVRSVDCLVAGAAAMGRGEVPTVEATGMRETDEVATALRRSAEQLRAREEELKGLNETLERRIAEATETLVQAQKLEALGRLTGGVAHDFNNLLAAVHVNLDLLARRLGDDPRVEFVHRARHAGDRGAKLTAQLLAFARKQRLEPEAVDVNAVISDMDGLLRSALGGATQIVPILAPGLQPAYADRTQLELIIMNLAINARDAMDEGGSIRIETRQWRVDRPPVRPEDPPAGDYVAITVADTGTGMPAEVLARVFEPFFTTKPTGKGSGLGLPQVLGVVKQLGGGVRIDSRVGSGTSVTIFLPPAEGRAAAAPAAEETSGTTAVANLRVLLVDDDADVRAAIAVLLQDMGCRVLEAHDGQAALACVESGCAVDIALVDYAMPAMTGAELARQLVQRCPGLRVLLMSGYMDAAALGQTWPGPVLQKPFTKEALASRLAELSLAGG